MSNYEFWDELGKIFNAVVAYQEKNIEFNKRFISPWIRLGNVFEKQDRNKDAINAYERAIEIDGGNPQNWFELGNLHFKMENYPEAVSALNKAIELDPALLPIQQAAFGLSAPTDADRINLYDRLGFYRSPSLNLPVSAPAAAGTLKDIKVSPAQLVSSAAALSNSDSASPGSPWNPFEIARAVVNSERNLFGFSYPGNVI